jgi:hypothetical protein
MDFEDVRRGLSAEQVFTDPAHKWKRKGKTGWAGGCPTHGSESGTCFHVDPETLGWHCFSCGEGGGPLEYAGLVDGLGPGADFLDQWKALSELTGCPPPTKDSPRPKPRPDRLKRLKAKAEKRKAEHEAAAGKEKRPSPTGGNRYDEQTLRAALVRYRHALKESGSPGAKAARAYVRGRGLSIDTLYRYGCGYAEPGAWLEDGVQKGGRHVHRSPRGRIVTPHTTPEGELVNLYGRAAGTGEGWLKHRHLKGNPKGLFNGQAIREGEGPLVVCEASLDALSVIEAGHARTVAVHGKSGLPWPALRGRVRHVVFALDTDAGKEARQQAREAALRGYTAHLLPAEAYGGAGDASEALQAGALDLSYVFDLARPATAQPPAPTEATDRPEGPEKPPDRRKPAEGESLSPDRSAIGDQPTAAPVATAAGSAQPPRRGQRVRAPFPPRFTGVGTVQDSFYSEDWGCYRVAVQPEGELPDETRVFCLEDVAEITE